MKANLGETVKIYDGRIGRVMSITAPGPGQFYWVHGDGFSVHVKGDRIFSLDDKTLFED